MVKINFAEGVGYLRYSLEEVVYASLLVIYVYSNNIAAIWTVLE